MPGSNQQPAIDPTIDSAFAHHQAGRLDEAARLYRAVVADQPGHGGALLQLGVIAYQTGDLDQALAWLNRATAVNPFAPAAAFILGEILRVQGRFEDAISNLAQAVALQPDFAAAHNSLGAALQAQGKRDAAAASFGAAIAHDPGFADAYNNLGNVLRELGKLDDAIVCYEQAIACQPNFAPAHCNLGNALQIAHQPEAAIAQYDEALALKPDLGFALSGQGHALRRLGRLDAAIDRFARVAALEPESAEVQSDLGVTLKAAGRLDEAIACFERARALDPADPAAAYNLGNALELCGQPARAGDALAQAMRLQPFLSSPCTVGTARCRILLLSMPGPGNTPTDYLVDNATYDIQLAVAIPGFDYDIAALAGGCDVVFNVIGDADVGHRSLPIAAQLIAQLGRPVINPPDKVARTGRAALAKRLADIPSCRMPETQRLDRAALEAAAASLPMPLLLRPAGAHGGDDLAKLETPPEIADYLARSTADDFYVTPFVDYASTDGFHRKYRLIVMNGTIYPYHLAIDRGWKLHYALTEMAEHAWMRREEEAFLADFTTVFGAPQIAALRRIEALMELDYFGIDCALDRSGDLLLFEANAAMLVHQNDDPTLFPYKRAHVAPIRAAFDRLVDRVRAGV